LFWSQIKMQKRVAHRAAPAAKRTPADGDSWTKVREIATGALVGAVVAIVLAPVSQSLTYYLSQFLSRPVLSIEYVERIPADRVVRLDSAQIQRLIQSTAFVSYWISHPAGRTVVAKLTTEISADQLDELRSSLRQMGEEVAASLRKMTHAEQLVQAEIDPDAIVKAIQTYHGSLFSSFAFASEPPDQMKASFLRQLQADRAPLTEVVSQLKSINDLVATASPPASDFFMKVSVLNRGDTDGLIRSTATLHLPDLGFSIPLLRMSPPKQPTPLQTAFAVQVAVTNPQEALIREQSVGKIEKHSMVEFWYAIDERKLPPAQLAALVQRLPIADSVKLRLTLADQELKEISYEAASR
jgi:hypothetical protein